MSEKTRLGLFCCSSVHRAKAVSSTCGQRQNRGKHFRHVYLAKENPSRMKNTLESTQGRCERQAAISSLQYEVRVYGKVTYFEETSSNKVVKQGLQSELINLNSSFSPSTYYDKNPGVEVFDGCSCASQETILSSRGNNHCVHLGHLLIDLHAHGAQSCQVHCTFIPGHQTQKERTDEVKSCRV